LESAQVPPAFQLCGIGNFEARTVNQKRAVSTVAEWCAGGSHGLFLHGAVGTGKTYLAVAALRYPTRSGGAGRKYGPEVTDAI